MIPDAGRNTQWKLPYLKNIISTSPNYLPYICITESWLKRHHTDAQINIPEYNLFRADRIDRSHGGVITYIHQNLSVSRSESFCNKYCEVVSVAVESEKTLLVNVYRPPNTPLSKFAEAISFMIVV